MESKRFERAYAALEKMNIPVERRSGYIGLLEEVDADINETFADVIRRRESTFNALQAAEQSKKIKQSVRDRIKRDHPEVFDHAY